MVSEGEEIGVESYAVSLIVTMDDKVSTISVKVEGLSPEDAKERIRPFLSKDAKITDSIWTQF